MKTLVVIVFLLSAALTMQASAATTLQKNCFTTYNASTTMKTQVDRAVDAYILQKINLEANSARSRDLYRYDVTSPYTRLDDVKLLNLNVIPDLYNSALCKLAASYIVNSTYTVRVQVDWNINDPNILNICFTERNGRKFCRDIYY